MNANRELTIAQPVTGTWLFVGSVLAVVPLRAASSSQNKNERQTYWHQQYRHSNHKSSKTKPAMMTAILSNPVTRRGRKHQSLLPPPEEIFAEGVFFKLKNEQNESSSLSRSSTVASDLKGLATEQHCESTCASSSSSSTASPACSAPNSWRSTDTESFILHQPLMVSDPDQDGESEFVDNEAEKLGEVMKHSQKLPGTWYFSSNHVMVRTIAMK